MPTVIYLSQVTIVEHLSLECLKVRDAITQSYGFGEKNPLFEKRKQKLYLTPLFF